MVSPVKNQGQCGASWVFSTIAFMESQSLIQGKADIFPEEQIVDCEKDSAGCSGGWPLDSFKYLETAGIEINYDSSANDICKYDKIKVVANISDVQCWENPTVAQLQGQVANTGPLQ